MKFWSVLFLHFELVPKFTLSIYKQTMSYTDQWCKICALTLYRGENGYVSNGKRLSYSVLQGIWVLVQNKGLSP